jgi:hypothetical protein
MAKRFINSIKKILTEANGELEKVVTKDAQGQGAKDEKNDKKGESDA